MKAVNRILALILAAGSAAAIAGCSSSSTSNEVTTQANWNIITSDSAESNYIEYWHSHSEFATYAISFEEGTNNTYSVSYNTEKAVYTTEFYIDKGAYDWSDESLPDSVKLTAEESEKLNDVVYVYETTLSISGTYTLDSNGETYDFEDSTYTVCKFRLSKNGLTPVYSCQKVKNTAPANLNASSAEEMFVTLNSEYETFYNKDCTSAVLKSTDNSDGTTVDLTSKQGYSVLDNSQIAVAARTFGQSGTSVFNVLVPQNEAVQTCTLTADSAYELCNETDASIITASESGTVISALENVTDENDNAVDNYIIFDGTPSDSESDEIFMRFTPVTLSISAELTGSSPTYCYATVENADLNATRAVLLKMQTPLSFGLGTLNYTLSKLQVKNI